MTLTNFGSKHVGHHKIRYPKHVIITVYTKKAQD